MKFLTTLELSGLPCSMPFLKTFAKSISRAKSLQSISFARTYIGDAGFRLLLPFLRELPNLTHLDFSLCTLTSASVSLLADAMTKQTLECATAAWQKSLRHYPSSDYHTVISSSVTLNDSEAGDADVKKWQRISLSCNAITDEGVRDLMEALKDEIGVRALDLAGNKITKRGGKFILHTFETNKEIVVIDVRNNLLGELFFFFF